MSSKQAQSNKERRQFWQMVIETWQDSGMSLNNIWCFSDVSPAYFYVFVTLSPSLLMMITLLIFSS